MLNCHNSSQYEFLLISSPDSNMCYNFTIPFDSPFKPEENTQHSILRFLFYAQYNMQLCLHTMYTLHVHAVISQLMTLFVPTYSTTNIEYLKTFDSNRFYMYSIHTAHTPYSRIICMSQKWEGDCGLWVLNEIILQRCAESLKKIVGAVAC